MKVISYVIILLIILLGISFAILNADPVSVHYYVGIAQLPLSLLLVFSFGIGIIIGFIVMGLVALRAKATSRQLRKKLRVAEEEIDNLRAIPIRDEH